MDDLIVFRNKDFGGLRVLEIDGMPWFVGKDIASILGYDQPHKAIKVHVDEDDGMKYTLIDSMGRNQNATFINESGLYSLILSSKLPTAKKFKKWVVSEVLPSIRKTGGYTKNNDMDFIIKSVTSAIMAQIPAITAEAVKLTLNSVLTNIDNVQTVNQDPEFRLLDIEDQPKELHTAADLEEADFWESLLKEWRKFRTFIKYKSEADQAFLALCHDKYPDLSINTRTLYRKWKSYQQDGKQSLIDMRGRHGNHRRKEKR